MGEENLYPANLLDHWKDFIDQIYDFGYSSNINEWNKDIQIREKIEQFIQNEQLQNFTYFNDFKTELEKIDNDLKKLLLPIKRDYGEYWFQTGIIKDGSGEYQKDIKELYNVDLKDY